MRWTQEDPAPNADPNMVELTKPQKIKEYIYCNACGKIDRPDRFLQEILDTEKQLGTKYWSKRFNLSGFATNVVELWLAYRGITRMVVNQDDLYNYMAEDMIHNTYDRLKIRIAEGRRMIIVDSEDETVNDNNLLFGWINGDPICGIALHVTRTKKRRNKRDGREDQ